jgi:hypothetical protein
LRSAVDAGARGVLARLDIALEPGWRTEINLHAVEWVRNAGAFVGDF